MIMQNAIKGGVMEEPDNTDEVLDDLDAFFAAAESRDPGELVQAAENIARTGAEISPAAESAAKTSLRRPDAGDPDAAAGLEALKEAGSLDGKFIAIDPDAIPDLDAADRQAPFVLIPAHIHSYVPWWGWTAIAITLAMMVAGVILTPIIKLDRLAARLDDPNQASVQKAMRDLVVKGDEKTVRKLYDMAASPRVGLATRLRAVDTMSLIERVPEVDRALLRLELTAANDQVREAAIAARRQREAYKTRGRR